MTMAHECEELARWIFFLGRVGGVMNGNERRTAHKLFFLHRYIDNKLRTDP